MGVRRLMAANAGLRVAFGLAVGLLPGPLEPTQAVPPTDDAPRARLYVRGFAAHHLAVGAFGLLALSRRPLQPAAAALAIGIDAGDAVAAAIEAAKRGRIDRDTVGGVALSALGFATAGPALRGRGR